MDNTKTTISVKANIFGQYRRFSVVDFQDLVSRLNSYNQTPTKEFDIFYSDSDGDWCLVESFNEWAELIKQLSTESLLKIELKRKHPQFGDFVQEKVELARENLIQKRDAIYRSEPYQATKEKIASISKSESYQATKEKIGSSMESVVKAFETFAETGKECVHDFARIVAGMVEDLQAPSPTSGEPLMATPIIQYPSQPSPTVEIINSVPSVPVVLESVPAPVYQPLADPYLVQIAPVVEDVQIAPEVEISEPVVELEEEVAEVCEYERELMLLAQMGFHERQRNIECLIKFNNDISKVVPALLNQ